MVRRIGIVDGFDVAKTEPQGHQKRHPGDSLRAMDSAPAAIGQARWA